MKINVNKTKMLRLNARRQDPIKINGTDVEDTDSFVYLGPLLTTWVVPNRTFGVGYLKLGVFFIDFQRCGEQVNSAEKLR